MESKRVFFLAHMMCVFLFWIWGWVQSSFGKSLKARMRQNRRSGHQPLRKSFFRRSQMGLNPFDIHSGNWGTLELFSFRRATCIHRKKSLSLNLSSPAKELDRQKVGSSQNCGTFVLHFPNVVWEFFWWSKGWVSAWMSLFMFFFRNESRYTPLILTVHLAGGRAPKENSSSNPIVSGAMLVFREGILYSFAGGWRYAKMDLPDKYFSEKVCRESRSTERGMTSLPNLRTGLFVYTSLFWDFHNSSFGSSFWQEVLGGSSQLASG